MLGGSRVSLSMGRGMSGRTTLEVTFVRSPEGVKLPGDRMDTSTPNPPPISNDDRAVSQHGAWGRLDLRAPLLRA